MLLGGLCKKCNGLSKYVESWRKNKLVFFPPFVMLEKYADRTHISRLLVLQTGYMLLIHFPGLKYFWWVMLISILMLLFSSLEKREKRQRKYFAYNVFQGKKSIPCFWSFENHAFWFKRGFRYTNQSGGKFVLSSNSIGWQTWKPIIARFRIKMHGFVMTLITVLCVVVSKSTKEAHLPSRSAQLTQTNL